MRVIFKSVLFFVVMFTLISSGCASTIETLDGRRLRIGSPQFSDYALDVFKRNNSTLTALCNDTSV